MSKPLVRTQKALLYAVYKQQFLEREYPGHLVGNGGAELDHASQMSSIASCKRCCVVRLAAFALYRSSFSLLQAFTLLNKRLKPLERFQPTRTGARTREAVSDAELTRLAPRVPRPLLSSVCQDGPRRSELQELGGSNCCAGEIGGDVRRDGGGRAGGARRCVCRAGPATYTET